MKERVAKTGLTSNAPYELFMLAISLLSLINLVLILLLPKGQPLTVVTVVDAWMALLFFVDFIRRLSSAPGKADYFWRQFGWADLLASVPLSFFNVFRVFRMFRVARYMRKEGNRNILRILYVHLVNTSLYLIFFCVILLIEFGSIFMLMAEQHAPNAVILTASDALWWAIVSITTVGYGDMYPVTNLGRYIGTVCLIIGVALYAVITGFVVNLYSSKRIIS